MRRLVTQADIDKICNAAVNNPAINYTTYFTNYTQQFNGYFAALNNSKAVS